MIEQDALKVGDECWYAIIELSSERGRINRREKPVKAVVKNTHSGWRGLQVEIETESGRNLTVSLGSLYKTREEAVEDWNSIIYNALDWIESDYQRKKRLIEKEKL